MIMTTDAFQVLSDPTRRRVIEALWAGERSVSDIVETVEIRQSGVSRHLRLLHEAGFVQSRPEGQKRLYSLRPEPFRELDRWLASCRLQWEARLDRFGEALEHRQRARGARKETQK
jgi:DNA-binding transcriptional ArsR family regulator